MKQKARDVSAYTKHGIRQCDLKIGPRLSRFSNGSVQRKAVDALFARRRELHFEDVRYQVSSGWDAVLFLQSQLQLTTAEVARVFLTSERRVLIWIYRAGTPRGRHGAMCKAIDDIRELAQSLEWRPVAGRAVPMGAPLREWFTSPNADLGEATPFAMLYTQNFHLLKHAMYQEVCRRR